ncbi:LamG domain-containing protein [Nonomuraea sp. NPDC050202]|uniref:LamG domain-containing protein n=1 Tax=Nonomuraea sp. NPDC050202 TaxID=3155035 RepID=UPI0033D89EDF
MSVPAGKLTDGWKIRWRARAVNTGATTTSAWSDWLAATVDVSDPGGQPTVTALQIDPSQPVNGQTVTTTLTPALVAQVTDPAGQPLRVEYEVEHDPAATEQGTGQIWTGALDNVASGAPARITVAEGRLQDGWKARWRTRALNTAASTSSAWSDWQEFQVTVIQPADDALAHTAAALIPTDGNFTVTAWLRWDDKDGAYTVVKQKGLHQAPFHLGNTPEDGLVFTFTSADSPEATTEGVRSQVEPPVNEWFHLAGVYEAASKKATLYLNGAVIKSETISFPAWRATGFTTLGTRMSGALDDVWIYDKALTTDEAVVAAGGTPQPAASPTAKTDRATTAAPVVTPVYHRIDPADCMSRNDSFYRPATVRVPPKNERGWTPGPHDWCVSQKPKFTVEVKTKLGWKVTDQAEFVLMTIGRTSNDSRTTEIDVITLAMNDAVKGAMLRDKVFTLGLMVQGSPAA